MWEIIGIIFCVLLVAIGYCVGYSTAEENQKRLEMEMENVILKEVLEDELF